MIESFHVCTCALLTCPFLMHALNIEVGCTVGVGTDQDPGLRKVQTQQFDALLQRTCLAAPKWTQHQRRNLNTKYTIKITIVSIYMHW